MEDNAKMVIIQFNTNETTKVLGLKQLNLTGDSFTISWGNEQELLDTIEIYIDGIHITSTESVSVPNNTDPYITITYKNIYGNPLTNIKALLLVTGENPQTAYIECDIQAEPNSSYKFYDNQCNMLESDLESFMLLRTNPKLTGNIKLVISDNGGMYLDTFKVSPDSILTKKIYRKQEISQDSSYEQDVYNVFKTLPNQDMYSLPPDVTNALKTRHEISEQIISDIYEYGAEINTDNLYEENMKILAPLYIGKHLPDYFIIFRTDLLRNNTITNLTDSFSEMLQNAVAVKVVDLRVNTPIGKYLNNYMSQCSAYLGGTCNLQFIEQDRKDGDIQQGKNTWKGIAYNKGLFVNKTETSYFANETLQLSNAQEMFDMFICNGFSRNNLLFPNIINMEFMFNDPTAADFSMHNYFGLYVTENAFNQFTQIVSVNDAPGNNISYYDLNNNLVDNALSTIKNVLEQSEYRDRLFAVSTPNNISYVKSISDVTSFINRYVLNSPYINLTQQTAKRISFGDNEKSFICMHIQKPLQPGEHFRFSAVTEDNRQIVLDIIASSDTRLLNMHQMLCPYISTNRVNAESENFSEPDVEFYRIPFYAYVDSQMGVSLEDQINKIHSCIQKFDSFLFVKSIKDNTISIMSNYEDTVFQHILLDRWETDKDDKEIPVQDHITYFNENIQPLTSKLKWDTTTYQQEDLYKSMDGFELNIDRRCVTVNFINTGAYNGLYLYEINEDITKVLKNTPFPLAAVTGKMKYAPIHKHNITVQSQNEPYLENVIMCPVTCDKSMVALPKPIQAVNGMMNICSSIPCNISILGINNIKDINSYVGRTQQTTVSSTSTIRLKAGTKVYLNNSDSAIQQLILYSLVSGGLKDIPVSPGTVFMIYDSILYYYDTELQWLMLQADFIELAEDTVIELASDSYMDIYSYITSLPVLQELNYYENSEEIKKIYNNMIGQFTYSSKTIIPDKLNIPLTIPVNAQWRSNGVYYDHNSVLDVGYLKPYRLQGNFIENINTPVTDKPSQYIPVKISDIILNQEGNQSSVKDFILTGKYKSPLKKIFASGAKLETAIGFYNKNIQTLEFIYYGIKFSFKLSNTQYINDISLNEFHNYEVLMIDDYTQQPNEIFISKTDALILIINHNYKHQKVYAEQNIKYLTDSIAEPEYKIYKGPYEYNLKNTVKFGDSYYLHKTENKILSSQTIGAIELDLMDTDIALSMPYNMFAYVQTNENFESLLTHDIAKKVWFGSSYNRQVNDDFSILYKTYLNTPFSSNELNKKQMFTIETASNGQNGNSSILSDYMSSITDSDTDLYIISGNGYSEDSTYTVYNINDSYRPLLIQAAIPSKIKFNTGLFNVLFNSIITFEVEDNISDTLNLDTLHANTHIKQVNRIPAYYQNKIMSANVQCKSQNYFNVSRNILSTDWDNNIFRIYDTETSFKNYTGYTTGITKKMFFGSKVLALHNKFIELNTWNFIGNTNSESIEVSSSNNKAVATNTLRLNLNISKTFLDTIKSNQEFTSNWNGCNVADTDTYVINYIFKTIKTYYNISDYEIQLWRKYVPDIQENESRFVVEKPDDLNTYTLCQNYLVQDKTVQDENYIQIDITDYEKYKYYPVIKINRFKQ